MHRISAVICTHNRARYLSRALESMAQQTLLPADYEVIVVDNASTDDTVQVVQQAAAKLCKLHYVREDRLGLSWARNTGAAVASAPYVAYLDDDARAEPHWLESILNCFQDTTPSPAIVGGRVWLDWDGGRPPSWLPERYWSLYTFVDHGDNGHLLTEHEYLVGANIAFCRHILLELGGFAPELGRKGTRLLSGEETALINRVRRAALALYYQPEAVVWHVVPQARQRKWWLYARVFWDGASQPLLDCESAASRRFYLHRVQYDFRRIVRYGYEWLIALLKSESNVRFSAFLALLQRCGQLRTNLQLAIRCPNKGYWHSRDGR